ncbi:MAG: crossover junction endodeoxyribonuclease RuvC [Alphaproteobacteria bacterium]|nr:crossover junction endodeoxyribonuclease RuvC [Alphaproteobacteria bacterium]
MNLSRVILGIDPGLRHTGWGVIAQQGNHLSFIAAGRINPSADLPMALRLLAVAEGIADIVRDKAPTEAAIEETFVNKNARSALLLGQARGSAILALAQAGLSVAEYSANRIKQSITGHGHAEKPQIQAMINILLPGSGTLAPDAADALAVAVTHAHHTGVEGLINASRSC